MTMMRLVSLKDFESHLRSSVTKLRSDATFCDVSLICSDFEVTAHKVILASSSDSFRRILQNNPHPHPIIYLTNVKKKDLVNLLNYMYEGEVEVAEEDTESLLKLFGELKVKGFEHNSSIHDNPRESAPDQAVQGVPTTWIKQDVLDDVLVKTEEIQDGPESSAATTSLNQSILMEDSIHGEDSRPENSTPALFQSSPEPSTFNLQQEGIAQGLVSDVASSASDKEDSQLDLIEPSSSLHLQPDLDVEDQSEQNLPTKRLSPPQPHEDVGSLSPPRKKRSRLSRSRNRRPEISSEPVLNPCQENDILDTDPTIQSIAEDPASEPSQPGGKVSLSVADEVDQAGEEDCSESNEMQQNTQNIIVLTKTESDQAKMKQIFANLFDERMDGTRAVWACKLCDKVCDTKSHMNSHVDFKHTDHLLHQCLQCSSSFRNNDGLTRHISKDHTLKLNQDDNNNSPGGREGRLSASSRREKMEWLQAQEAIMYAQLAKSTDTGLNLQIEYFGDAGRGLVTTCDRVKGDFVVEYAGELLDRNTARVREEKYDSEGDTQSYMYYFVNDGHKMCVDATEESDRLGRLINHSMQDPNLATRVVTVDGDPRLVLYAKKDIKAGTELKFDYGDRNKETMEANPWMKQ